MAANLPMNYYSCSNSDPDLDDPNAKPNFPYLEIASIVIHVLIKLRISWFQRREKAKDELKPNLWMTNQNLSFRHIEVQSIPDFTTNVIALAMCSSYALLGTRINSLTLVEINLSPNFILMNIYQLIGPCLISSTISIGYYSRHPLLRKTMWRELKNWLFWLQKYAQLGRKVCKRI